MYRKILLILAGVTLLAGCGGGSPSDATTAEKTWVRAYMDDDYLWYDKIVDVPPDGYATAPDYFDALLVRSEDRFSFSMPLADAISTLQEGLDTGYGVRWGWAANGRLYAYYVDPGSHAAVSITRGTEITAINGQPLSSLTTPYLDSLLFPGQPDVPVTLTIRPPGTSTTRTASLVSATFSTTTVARPLLLPLAGGGKAGYLLFNEHLLTSEQGLNDAMTYFKQQGVSELVLDMRYNPGGYLMIAEELASMIGGGAVQGKVFEKLLFNSRHPEKTGDPDNTYHFDALDSTGASLPLLGVKRLFVLTGSNTCSASEAVINGLMPYIPVYRIGWTTCGKPYGFRMASYDQQAYFAIQFEGVNANGTDDYKSGFAPTCRIAEDLNYPLGDIREARLNAALYFMSNNVCPPAPTVTLPKSALSGDIPAGGDVRLIDQKPGLKLLR